MTTTNDVLPVALRNLVSYLVASGTLNGVDVDYGPVREYDREHVFIGDSLDEDTADFATIGPSPAGLDVTLSFSVTVVVATPGLTGLEALERAFELRGAVEQVIRDNPKLGLSAAVARLVSFGRLRHQFIVSDEGVGCDAGLVVSILARI